MDGTSTHLDAFHLLKDHWRYDPIQDRWHPLEYHPLIGRFGPVAFGGNGKGYLLTGVTLGIVAWDPVPGMLEYDIAADHWQELSLPVTLERSGGSGFWIGGKGYLAFGNFQNDLWEFDPGSGNWSQKSSLPAAGRSGARAVVMNNKAYLIGGDTTSNHLDGMISEVWEYDPNWDSWEQRSSYPGSLGHSVIAIDGKAYLSSNDEMWEYDPLLDIWLPKTPAPVALNGTSFAFSIGTKGILGEVLQVPMDPFARSSTNTPPLMMTSRSAHQKHPSVI